MKNNKKNIYSIIILCFVAASLYITNKTIQYMQKKDVSIQETSTDQEAPKTSNYDPTYLAQQEEQVWQELASIDITKEQCEALRKTNYKTYLSVTENIVHKDKTISISMQKMVQDILKEFGLDPNAITLAAWNGQSPAQAGDWFININEKYMEDLSEETQKFVIAHEVQHIINQDHSTDFLIYQQLPKADWHRKFPADHPIMKYYRFREERADIQAAMKSPTWAKYYQEYAQEIVNKAGDSDDPSHPKNSERLKIAQNIVQMHNQTV